MNMKRFTARTSREALAMVRQTFGEDAVVMSTRPCAEGVEVLAMAPESVMQLDRIEAPKVDAASLAPNIPAIAAKKPRPSLAERIAAATRGTPRVEPTIDAHLPVSTGRGLATSVEEDVADMAMSTLSFQDFVRERMLKRRATEIAAAQVAPAPSQAASKISALRARVPTPVAAAPAPVAAPVAAAPIRRVATAAPVVTQPKAAAARSVPVLHEEIRVPQRPVAMTPAAPMPTLHDSAAQQRGHDGDEMISELRSMRGLIEQRFGALAFMEKLQRQPRHATLTQTLLEHGFSPQLIRRLAESLPADGDPMAWASGVLERNLMSGDALPALEEHGGVYALIGSTGVGKTTSTAKLAAAFAARHGAAQLGLITLDAYRIGAHDQLRAYGRILGVPVHTAHDRASLEDLLELFSAKKMVLIDTAGMAQRDSRTRELLEMLSHASVQRLLVVNAAAQGETFEDVLGAYGAQQCKGVILSKIDEAVKLGPALDVLIRHKLKVLAVANGQRVPEDWHRLSANALVQRALRSQSAPAWRHDLADMNLVFAGVPHPAQHPQHAPRAAMHAAALQ
jgi:flagellar biosynthesis protein FlhF